MRRRSRLTALPLAVSAAALLLASCGQASKPVEAGAPAPTTGAANSTTSAAPAAPTFPLTGLPLAPGESADHAVVVVKMDNSPDARPQSGINQADVVYELLVEGITRYALVFQSQDGDPVGPVRSGRSSDPPLLANLARPLIGWSGGNPGVTNEILQAADEGFLVDAGYNAFPADYWRDNTRKAPHNLYTTIAALREHASPAGATAPPPLFSYRAVGEPATVGTEVSGVTIDYGLNVRADYAWDGERGGWDRFQVDELHPRPDSATVDGDGVQVAPANVVILFLQYGQSPSDARSPMAISSGQGEALVLTGGRLIHGSWNRPTPLDPWNLLDDAGHPILLTPGKTWVSLPEVGSAVTPLDAATAGELLAVKK